MGESDAPQGVRIGGLVAMAGMLQIALCCSTDKR
jgi:hypothetical protein